MSFMQLTSDHFRAYSVETTAGTCIVPCVSVNPTYLMGDYGNDEYTLDLLAPFCEGTPMEYNVVEGWFARYSAPGYLDCTDWVGPCESEETARAECKELYGDEDE